MMAKTFLIFSSMLSLAIAMQADVRMPKFFSDNMVLQRDTEVNIWGWAEPGEKVTVKFSGQEVSTAADKEGDWSIKLAPMKANSSGQELSVQGKNSLKFSNILVGDVWMASGQSNSMFALGSCNAPEDVQSAEFPLIRYSGYWECFAASPQKDGGSKWQVVSPKTAAGCCGMGFYFARKLQKELKDVPVGILECGVGGTEIECWMSPQAINNYPENSSVAKRYRETIEQWEKELPSSKATPGKRPGYLPVDEPIGLDLGAAWAVKVRDTLKASGTSVPASFIELEKWIADAKAALAAGKHVPPQPELADVGNWLLKTSLPENMKRIPILPHPTERNNVGGHGWFRTQSLYNGMVHPLLPFKFKGMLWYQGENGSGKEYYWRMLGMVESLRKKCKNDFPVYAVQLPNHGEAVDDPAGDKNLNNFPLTREEQLKCLKIPNTGMVVAIDVGDAKDLHPKNKLDVGERLALWALAKDYGRKDLVLSGPIYKSMKTEGSKIRIDFEYTGGGLMAAKKEGRAPAVEDKGAKLKCFAVAGEDRKWHWADAVIDGNTILVSSPDVAKPVAVRYAYASNPSGCNLYNREGLPASPFRTDNW